MPDFRPGVPVVSSDPTVVVDATSGLRPGRHRFQLVVEDDAGNASEPTTVEVIVVDDTRPTAVLDAPPRATVGRPFQLSGARSSDIGGRIVKYRFTLLAS